MGLDVVELVMEVEDTFQIEIAYDDYADIRTVGDLHQYILRQLQGQYELQLIHPTCPSVPPFLAIRKALRSLLPVQRHQLRPRTELVRIIPRDSRRTIWDRFQSLTNIKLPPLILPKALRAIVATMAATLFAVLTLGALYFIGPYGLIVAFMTSLGIWYFLYISTRPLAVAFPSNCSTITDVVRFARPPRYPPQRSTPISTDSDHIWKRLVQIIVDILNVKESEVTSSTRFIEDLRVG